MRPIGIRIREVSTRKVQHPWGKVGEKDGGGWGQTQPGAPAPNPRSDIVSVLRLGIALDCVVSAVAASYTANTPGGWVGCMEEISTSVSSMVMRRYEAAWG